MIDFLISLDKQINIAIPALRSAWLTKIFYYLTLLGNWPIAAIAVILFSAILWFKNGKKYLFPFYLVVVGSSLSGQIIKLIFHRFRPVAEMIKENTYSFPSGHATLAVALYGFITYFLWHRTLKSKNKTLILVFGAILILLIGFSRIYLGVHYLSDVLAGYLLGSTWLIIGILIIERPKLKFKK